MISYNDGGLEFKVKVDLSDVRRAREEVKNTKNEINSSATMGTGSRMSGGDPNRPSGAAEAMQREFDKKMGRSGAAQAMIDNLRRNGNDAGAAALESRLGMGSGSGGGGVIPSPGGAMGGGGISNNDLRALGDSGGSGMNGGFGARGGGGGGSSGGAGGAGLFSQGSRLRFLRYTVGGVIVSTIASELNNQENWKAATRLAGMDQGAQAGAVMARARGAFGAVPIIGGALYQLANGIIGASGGPSEQSINMQMDLTSRQTASQDFMFAAGQSAGIQRQRAGIAGARFSPGSYSFLSANVAEQQRRQAFTQETNEQRGRLDTLPMEEAGFFGGIADYYGGSSVYGQQRSNARNARNASIEKVNDQNKKDFQTQRDSQNLAAYRLHLADQGASLDEREFGNREGAERVRSRGLANQYQPIRGAIQEIGQLGQIAVEKMGRAMISATAEVERSQGVFYGTKPGDPGYGAARTGYLQAIQNRDLVKSDYRNTIGGLQNDAGGIAREAYDNQMFGSTVGIHAGQSVRAYYDPRVESPATYMGPLVGVMQQLSNALGVKLNLNNN